MMRLLTPALRPVLQQPWGELMDGKEVVERLRKVSALVISIGDACSHTLISSGLTPGIVVYDGKVLREPCEPRMRKALDSFNGTAKVVANPAGVITRELELAMHGALSRGSGKIFVEGEEDLAALVAFMRASDGSIIIYGQPGKGVVMATQNDELRRRAWDIFLRMEVG